MAGFEVNYAGGKLTIGSYVIPNHAVKMLDEATLGFWFKDLKGDDVEVVDSLVTYPRVAKEVRATVPLIVGDDAAADGTAATDKARQLKENISALNAICGSTTSGTGVTSVSYVPWVGASTRTFNAVILPPIIGQYTPGVGVKVGVTFILPGGVVT